MKKMFLNFAEQMLSKDQLKKVKGGCGAPCYWSCSMTCGNGNSWSGAGDGWADYNWMVNYYCGSTGGNGTCNPGLSQCP